MKKEIVLPADELYVPSIKLRAGDISALYEGGRLRYLSAGDGEIIRMIYPALRDQDWGTIPPIMSEERISKQQKSFFISYTASYEADEIKYRAFYTIEGKADSSVVFSMRGEALSDFKKRRIGLCLLHPIGSCSGRDITVLQPNGSGYSSSFPEFVSPFQPFLNVQGMKWIMEDKTSVTVNFEGDIFETEDQRNWSDNSYKTYSTPLSVPAPAMVRKGDIVEQRITVHADLKNTVYKKTAPRAEEIKVAFPQIGYARTKNQQPFTVTQIELLKKIPFDHYRVQLDLAGDWKNIWRQAIEEAKQLETKIELVVNFNLLTDEIINEVVDIVRPLKEFLFSILILSAGHETAPLLFFESAYEIIKKSLGNISVGYGTNNHFADINRNRPTDIEFDFANFHLQPQVHTTDNRSIMENLGSHETMIGSANKFTGSRPVHVSPVTFVSEGVVDKRFSTSFAAWWTLQALRNLSAASAISFYELTGDMGIINGEKKTVIYEMLATIKAFSPKYILQNTGYNVIVENESGGRLIFTSELPAPESVQGSH